MVVPLLPAKRAPRPASTLNPVFRIGTVDYVMATQYMAAAPARILKHSPFSLAHRRDDGDHVFHGVEHDHDGGAHQHRVGNPDRVGVGPRQLLHQPHHVVAKVAENAGGHGRQHVRQLDPAFGDERAQRRQRRPVAGHEAISPVPRRAADLGLPSHCAPNEIGIESDDRIAPAQRAAFHRLQQKAERPRGGDLEEGRYRGLEIRDERGPHDLWLASRVALGKCRGLRLDLHGPGQFAPSPAPPLTTWLSAL